ncbi:MAG: cupin domain-containing protein [Patescibacteria group bacterium]
MKGYVDNIEKLTLENTNFRHVLYTDAKTQLVVMCIQPNEDIGEEVHTVDQFLRIEQGIGQAILDGVPHEISDGSAIVVPAGTRHNIVNAGAGPLKLYTIYSPPEHIDGTIHATKVDAIAAEETDHFDGKTTE